MILRLPPVLASLILAFAAGFAFSADGRPNILFIMSDDHASHAISAYGSKLNDTPHLDRLAKEGMLFRNCFVTNSICTPSRATLLTGKYSHANGTPVFNRFDGSQPIVSRMMQKAGYHTGMIGKWHLGSDPEGFDYWEILPGQGVYNSPALYTAAGQKTYTGEYVTNVITDLAAAFIRNRPKDKPFLLFCHHKAPHREWTPTEKYREQFAGKTFPEPATLRDDYATRTDALRENEQTVAKDLTRRDLKLTPPESLTGPERNKWLGAKPDSVERDGKTLTGDELVKFKYQRYMQDYLACVQSVDDSVGALLDLLKEQGIDRNTIVIYTSDNGFFLGDHGLYDKRFIYEHSLRIPFLVRWPAAIKPGSVTDAISINTDFAPTFLDAAGEKSPADMQGRSLLPIFRGETPGDWRTAMYYRYYHDPGHHNTRAHLGIRTQTHKLIHYWKKDQWEMFDLKSDPDELRNLYNDPASQEIVRDLKAQLQRLKTELKDEDQFADKQPNDAVDGPVNQLRNRAAKGLPSPP
jgi:arylsulfatase A-like enzyme